MEGRHDGGMAILGLVVLGSPALSRPRAVTEEQAADGYATMVPLEVLREQYEQAQSRETDLGLRQTALKRQRDHLAAQIPPLQGRRDQDAEVVRLDTAIQRVQAEAAAAERERQRLLDMPRPAPQAAPQEVPGATPARRRRESPATAETAPGAASGPGRGPSGREAPAHCSAAPGVSRRPHARRDPHPAGREQALGRYVPGDAALWGGAARGARAVCGGG